MPWSLVTGGAKRLGSEICHALAEKGYPIVVHYRKSQDQAMEVVEDCRKKGVRAEAIQGDFSTPETTQDFIRNYYGSFGETKNLIHNVGNYLVAPASKTTPEEWNALFQTNLHAPFALTHALLPSLKEHQGNIITLGVAGITNPRADVYSMAYTSTKTALLHLTKSLAKELVNFGVSANMVSPGYLENAIDLPEKLPRSRAASLQEVARVVAFLLDEENHYMTGQNIEVAGGVRL